MDNRKQGEKNLSKPGPPLVGQVPPSTARSPKKSKVIDEDQIRASDIEVKPIHWLWGGRVPKGMISLIAGRPDQGKSLLTAFFAAEITRQGHHVILSNREDSPSHVLRPRLEAAGAVLDKVHFFHPYLPQDVNKLRDKIKEHNVKLVIMDPVAAHLGVSIYQDQDVRKALTPLTQLCSETDCSVMLVHHTTKGYSKKSHPLDAIGGSSGGLPGAARVIFLFGINPNNEDERAMVPIKFNIAAMPKSVTFEIDEASWTISGNRKIRTGRLVMLDDDVQIDPTKLLAGKGDAAISAEKRALAAEWLVDYLCDGAKKVTELKPAASLEGIAWRTLRRAGDEIGVLHTRHGGGGPGSYTTWELPPDHPALEG